MKINYTEQEIITGIKKGGQSLNQVMLFLYSKKGYKMGIINLVQTRGGTKEDGEDIFQEGIRYLILNIRENKFQEKSTIKSYLFAICKNLWHTKSSRKQNFQRISAQFLVETTDSETPEVILSQQERSEQLDQVLTQLGDKCRQVLGFWSLNYSMSEIAEMTGYKSEEVVRKKKHLCLKKLVLLVHNNPDLMKQLMEE